MGENILYAEFRRLSEGSEKEAGAALKSLEPVSRRFLSSFLNRRWHLQEEDREDIIQETLVRVFRVRERFQFENEARWFALLKTIAHNISTDRVRKQRSELVADIEDEKVVPLLPKSSGEEELLQPLVAALINSTQKDWLEEALNTTLLGFDPALTLSDQTRRLLAAQYYYLDGLSVEEILQELPSTGCDSPLTREELRSWLSDQATQRLLAYQELYFSNARLACFLLGLQDSQSLQPYIQELNRYNFDESSPLTREQLYILRHILLAESPDRLLDLKSCSFTREELDLLERYVTDLYPFTGVIARLQEALADTDVEKSLGSSALWQRLNFQYRCSDELNYQEILDRIGPAAERVGYRINLETLGTWQNRTVTRLTRFRKMYRERDGRS